MRRYPEAEEKFVTLGKVHRAASACASTRAEYAFLNVDVCVSRTGGPQPPAVSGGHDASKFLHEVYPIASMPTEAVFVLLLNVKNVPIGTAIVHKGDLSGSTFHPRDVLRPAIMLPTSAVIIAHNHPSGDATPSPQDDDITDQVRSATRILRIRFLDHVVLTADPDVYWSYAEKGR